MDNKYYGIVIEYEFIDNPDNIKYIYSPIGSDEDTLMNWYDSETDQFDNSDKQFIRAFYWTLTKYSSTTIKRDKEWFSMISPNIKLFWDNVCNARKQIKEDPASAETILKLENRPVKKVRKKLLNIENNDICICDD